MKVFKFGGASVKDAQGVRNVAAVVERYAEDELVIVVSAMGKTTNALEEVVAAWHAGSDTAPLVDALESSHLRVLQQVAPDEQGVREALKELFTRLRELLTEGADRDADRDYDRVVAFGELWSTLIVHAHLNAVGLTNAWKDARQVVRTDACHRSARVDWAASEKAVGHLLENVPAKPRRVVTQGFIGGTGEGITTTLGREGSDFSAAILAFLLDAESVTIWKDVAGMFNADPNRFPDTVLLERISYREAIELSYFGASVIHPRTLQPLQRKQIPLYVRSFLEAEVHGTTINSKTDRDSLVPSFIVKPGQLLISISPRDLSFVVEEHLYHIFGLFAKARAHIALMQNSAVAFSVVVDDNPRNRELINELVQHYEVRYNAGCELVTVRHYNEAVLKRLLNGREPLVEQRSRNTARFVLK